MNFLEALRTDLAIDLRNSTDEVELSLAVTGIEILLSVLSGVVIRHFLAN